MRRSAVVKAAIAAVVVTVAVSGTLPAAGVHWPMFGGDAGRSGFQPVAEGGVPARLEWKRVGLVDRDVRTSIITTAGPLTDQRLAYGTDRGDLIVRRLLGGGFLNVTDLSAAANAFGSGSASVTPVSSSTSAGLGQIFAVHNERYANEVDDNLPGLQLAQIDETTGARARADVDLAGTFGFVIESSPALTPPTSAGGRSLFFVARSVSGSTEALFKVDIANASSPSAVASAAVSTGDINANPTASPTLVWLNAADGTPTMYVAVGTINGLRTFRASDFAEGPAAPGLGQNVRTPSTPVTASGLAPGQAGSGASVTPAIYAATTEPGGATSRIHKLTQDGNDQVLDAVSSAALAGDVADGLMTDSIAGASGASEGTVYVGTAAGLFALRASDLVVLAKVDGSFRNTVPAGTGDIVAVTADDGHQLILDQSSGVLAPVGDDLFREDPANADSQKAFGQPSISRGLLQFGSDRGVFVYGLPTPPTGYWLVASDGGIFSYGDAEFFGSTGDIKLNKPIVGMAPTTSDRGYWLVASDGGIFSFGDAQFFGSTGDMTLNKPIVGMAATPSGLGYWLVASDGGIFSFGDAQFFGSTGAMTLNKPIIGMTPATNGRGYWLIASDGGVFSFGGVGFFGSTGDLVLNSPIVAVDSSATSAGYLFTAADGGVFAFGDAPFLGSAASLGRLNSPVVGMAAKP